MAMSATPISLLCRQRLRTSLLSKAKIEPFGRVLVPGAGLEFDLCRKRPRLIPDLRVLAACPDAPGQAVCLRSALDIRRPGLFDQLDHRFRHRNVVEFLGHLAALGASPFEE